MSSQFHNRLVGTVVLVALGVIFLPDILDGKKERHEEVFSEIPLRPSVEAANVPDGAFKELNVSTAPKETDNGSADDADIDSAIASKATRAEVVKPIPTKFSVTSSKVDAVIAQKKTTATVESSKSSAVKVIPPVVEPDVARVAWTLQLGSFNHAGNVKALVAQLRKAGITAYTLPSTPVDGQLTKVFVGPDVSQEKLRVKQKQVEKLTKLKGRIVTYKPLNK